LIDAALACQARRFSSGCWTGQENEELFLPGRSPIILPRDARDHCFGGSPRREATDCGDVSPYPAQAFSFQSALDGVRGPDWRENLLPVLPSHP